jgi:hypothetical protein
MMRVEEQKMSNANLQAENFRFKMRLEKNATLIEELQYKITAHELTIQAQAAELAALREAARWIPVGERLPEKDYVDVGDEVLVMLDYPYERVTSTKFRRYDDGDFDFFQGGYGSPMVRWTKHVTHWRPLPAAPEEQ